MSLAGVLIGAIGGGISMGGISSMSSMIEDGADKGVENWDGSIELSASAATGNTDNTVLGARFEARRVLGRFTHDLSSGANYAETTTTDSDGNEVDNVTQNNWYVQYRLDVQTGDRTFLYARTRYEQDEFSGFDSRAFVGVGVGHTPIENDQMVWNLLAGPGVQYTMLDQPEDPDEMLEGDDTDVTVAVYAGSDFEWTIRENVSLEHDLDVTWAEDNTTLATQAAIKTKLTDTISSRLSYQVKHETDPPVGREATDTLLRASVAYGF